MAEESLISSLYPPPPPYYKVFTDENIEKFKESNLPNITEDNLSEENKSLQYLIPPKPPTGDTYRSFGNIWHVSDILGTSILKGVLILTEKNSSMIKFQDWKTWE